MSGIEHFVRKRILFIFGVMRQKEFMDEELGKIVIRENSRARRIILRATIDGILITIPSNVAYKEALDSLDKFREKLLIARKKIARSPVCIGFRLDSGIVTFSVVKGESDHFLVRKIPGEIILITPPDTDFNDYAVQKWLRKVIVQSLKKNAPAILLPRIKKLSETYGFTFHSMRVTTSQSRWGSCSSGKNINLSCYLLLVPLHLVDYVILHELCHTIEMNHGEKFWELLDGCTGKKARQLREELKGYRTSF